MALADFIQQAAGSDALAQIGKRVGLDTSQLRNVIDSVALKLGTGMAAQVADGGLGSVPSLDQVPPGSDAAADHGNSVLGSILGSKNASRSLATDASASTGIHADKIKAVLPQLASIAAVALASHEISHTPGGLGGVLAKFGLS
ncbi:MAG: hypothetical protein KGM17_12820 [Sphingomonadales bacterium]|nr:hypothetical protein [Sphingomonadales bacterium]